MIIVLYGLRGVDSSIVLFFFIFCSGDDKTLSRLRTYLDSGKVMREESLRNASLPCAPLKSSLDDEEFYWVESTRAIVTLSSSIGLLYFYCSRLPSDGLVANSL